MIRATRPAVEPASWRKSSYSNATGGNCVEIATNIPGHTSVRDSKDPHGPALTFPGPAFTAFLTALRADSIR